MKPDIPAAASFTALILACLSTMTLADDHGSLHLDNVWARATPPGASTGAGYLTIHNHGGDEDRLTGASVEFAERVEIHRSVEEDGMARMEKLAEGLPVPANGMVSLSPGGYHLMFLELNGQLVKGDTHALTLKFEQAGEQEVTLEVRAHDSDGDNHHHHH